MSVKYQKISAPLSVTSKHPQSAWRPSCLHSPLWCSAFRAAKPKDYLVFSAKVLLDRNQLNVLMARLKVAKTAKFKVEVSPDSRKGMFLGNGRRVHRDCGRWWSCRPVLHLLDSHLLRRKRNCICLLLWFPSGSRSSGGQPELWPNLVTFAIPMSLSSSGVRRTTATQGTQGTAPMPWCPSSPSSSQLLLSWSDPTCETIPLSSCHQSIKRWSCIFAFFCNEDKSLSSSVQCSQEWEWKKSEGLLTRQVLCLPFISKWFGETDFLLPSLLSPALHHNHWPTAANVTAMRFIYLIKCEQRPQQITNQSRRKREFHTIANNKIGGPRLNPRSLFTLVCSQQNCPRKYSVL